MTRKFTFRQTDQKPLGSVELDGEDISRLVRSISLDSEAGHLPEVTLDLMVVEVETVTDETRVHMAPGTAELLVRLGWSPPEEDR